MAIPLPSAQSLAHRARIAALTSELRPTHWKTHPTKLPAHRIPTLWTLYRGLLRNAATDIIRNQVRTSFREKRKMRVQGDLSRELRRAHHHLDVFRKARDGDTYYTAVCQRYSRWLENAYLREVDERAYFDQVEWFERGPPRIILTGAFHRPTLYNGPLPRMRPQPDHVSGMINKRRKARQRRIERMSVLQENSKLLQAEGMFEEALAERAATDGVALDADFHTHFQHWLAPISDEIAAIGESFEREHARIRTPYPPALLATIARARRERVRNKTHERERERRGEVTNRLRRQQRQMPPPHVLALMTPEQRRLDYVSRGVSEVGYVGLVKKKLGFTLRDPEMLEETELGRVENREGLGRLAREIEWENRRRSRGESGARDEQCGEAAV